MLDYFYIILDNSDLLKPYVQGALDILVLVVWFVVIRVRGFTYKMSLKTCLLLLLCTMLTLPIPVEVISGTFSHAAFLFFGFGIVQYVYEITKTRLVVP